MLESSSPFTTRLSRKYCNIKAILRLCTRSHVGDAELWNMIWNKTDCAICQITSSLTPFKILWALISNTTRNSRTSPTLSRGTRHTPKWLCQSVGILTPAPTPDIPLCAPRLTTSPLEPAYAKQTELIKCLHDTMTPEEHAAAAGALRRIALDEGMAKYM